MTYIANPLTRLDQDESFNSRLSHLAYLINICMKIAPSGTLLTAVTDATTIDTLCAGIEAINVKASEKRRMVQLSDALRAAYNFRQMDATDIAAFTSVNTASTTLDLLYGLCTQHNATLKSNYLGCEGGAAGGEFYAPSSATI